LEGKGKPARSVLELPFSPRTHGGGELGEHGEGLLLREAGETQKGRNIFWQILKPATVKE